MLLHCSTVIMELVLAAMCCKNPNEDDCDGQLKGVVDLQNIKPGLSLHHWKEEEEEMGAAIRVLPFDALMILILLKNHHSPLTSQVAFN